MQQLLRELDLYRQCCSGSRGLPSSHTAEKVLLTQVLSGILDHAGSEIIERQSADTFQKISFCMPLECHCSTTVWEMITVKLAICGAVLFLLKKDNIHFLMEELVPNLSTCCRKKLNIAMMDNNGPSGSLSSQLMSCSGIRWSEKGRIFVHCSPDEWIWGGRRAERAASQGSTL